MRYDHRCELGDVQSRRAEETAKIETQADIDRRHPRVVNLAGERTSVVDRAASGTSAGLWSSTLAFPRQRHLVCVEESRSHHSGTSVGGS